MPAGEAFSAAQRRNIEKALTRAESTCGFPFSVYVGASSDRPRAFAEARHAELADPTRTVLVLVDPAGRALEIVTGAHVRHSLSDQSVALAALSMQTAFAAGDLANGIVQGVNQLAQHARTPETLHADNH